MTRGAAVDDYLRAETEMPLLLHGDAVRVLKLMPDECIDFVMTSPPYWTHREYEAGGIGQEKTHVEYLDNLLAVISEIRRVLKPTGSFWLNIGDGYNSKKSMLGLPWRLAIRMMDEQRWVMRNEVIWNKVKGGFGNRKDRLENVHESVFHFVKEPVGYYYDADAIRTKPREGRVVDGMIVSATGVKGIRYQRQIELSTALNPEEKTDATNALNAMLEKIRTGELHDFRMMIRGYHRPPHSNHEKVSGRARELQEKGFCFLRYHPKGTRPSDVWDILPEDTHRSDIHFAPYPIDLCRNPILASCPPGGVILDPFCGTGTTLLAALTASRKSIGIDVSHEYLRIAGERLKSTRTKNLI
ncbi:site-specific DNA-methyltransferase [Caballeronia sp. LZ001]|uniref:DNA-methyltransferase n=1 Tax=Caballeronia sp. LZ001 TaxID=3038553 RepID=UPI002860A79B|nr:site-specific DNA-methyltransferase [Caballeronia sp. LZ001]MDR5803487.1 site-specific DNA-methyltransferase [Caballeronia sp. LZ001]